MAIHTHTHTNIQIAGQFINYGPTTRSLLRNIDHGRVQGWRPKCSRHCSLACYTPIKLVVSVCIIQERNSHAKWTYIYIYIYMWKTVADTMRGGWGWRQHLGTGPFPCTGLRGCEHGERLRPNRWMLYSAQVVSPACGGFGRCVTSRWTEKSSADNSSLYRV